MSKGKDTQSRILDKALDLASQVGLEGLTIGNLAKSVNMSKSGLYAHFKSKEDLQSQVLNAAAGRFVEVVFLRAIKEVEGLAKLRKLFECWLKWISGEFRGGCPFVAAATEFDDRKGSVHDKLLEHEWRLLRLISEFARRCVDEGDFREDLDIDQFAFEFWAIILAFHHFVRLLRHKDAHKRANQAFENLVRGASRT